MALYNEVEVLGFTPRLYIDANCPLVTPYDILRSQSVESKTQHGSTGMGVGATFHRNYYLLVGLFGRDALYPTILETKVNLIRDMYKKRRLLNKEDLERADNMMPHFLRMTINMANKHPIIDELRVIPNFHRHIVFEGAQGIMLDMNYGFFPHVTYSNTICKNAMSLIEEWGLVDVMSENLTTHYVTRAYATRHGNGPLPNETDDLDIKNPDETNKDDGYQGKFRYGVLDMDLLKYAVSVDSKYNVYQNKSLIMTCLDQLSNSDHESTFIVNDGITEKWSVGNIANELGIPNYVSCSTASLQYERV